MWDLMILHKYVFFCLNLRLEKMVKFVSNYIVHQVKRSMVIYEDLTNPVMLGMTCVPAGAVFESPWYKGFYQRTLVVFCWMLVIGCVQSCIRNFFVDTSTKSSLILKLHTHIQEIWSFIFHFLRCEFQDSALLQALDGELNVGVGF